MLGFPLISGELSTELSLSCGVTDVSDGVLGSGSVLISSDLVRGGVAKRGVAGASDWSA